jgi:hypothetical protein
MRFFTGFYGVNGGAESRFNKPINKLLTVVVTVRVHPLRFT